MSEPHLDLLAEAARNRSLKLVRSRVRTPGKRRFGKVGLTDKTGKPVFGMDAKGPTAKPEEVERYLRKLNVKDWGASLDAAAPQRKRMGKRRAAPVAANDERANTEPKAKRASRPKAPPAPRIRAARPADAAALVRLSALQGAKVDEKGVRKRVSALAREKLAPLVATIGAEVVGLCAIERMTTVHRDLPVGRISTLVVAEHARGRGIGRLLTEAAEDHLRKLGCGLLEVTSNDRLTAAHAFYRHLGYERTSIRFCKPL